MLAGLARARASSRRLRSPPDRVEIGWRSWLLGLGLMAGIELNHNCQALVGQALARQRLLITVTRESTIRLLPPLVCDEAQIDEIVARVAHLLAPAAAAQRSRRATDPLATA